MLLVPIAIVSVILASLLRSKGAEKKIPPKRTPEQQQSDELITTILPTIDNNR